MGKYLISSTWLENISAEKNPDLLSNRAEHQSATCTCSKNLLYTGLPHAHLRKICKYKLVFPSTPSVAAECSKVQYISSFKFTSLCLSCTCFCYCNHNTSHGQKLSYVLQNLDQRNLKARWAQLRNAIHTSEQVY